MDRFAMMAGIVSGMLLAGHAAAQLAPEGKYEHLTCYGGPHYMIAHSDTVMAGAYAVRGVGNAPPGDPFHDAACACHGAWQLVGTEFVENGACECKDGAGDRFMGTYSRRNQDPGAWRMVGGTGKFRGISGTGNFLPATQVPQPDGQILQCNRETGVWKLRP